MLDRFFSFKEGEADEMMVVDRLTHNFVVYCFMFKISNVKRGG